MVEKRFSAIVSMRIDSENMDSAICEIEDYLMKNDFLCHLHYIVEEANNVKQSNGNLMSKMVVPYEKFEFGQYDEHMGYVQSLEKKHRIFDLPIHQAEELLDTLNELVTKCNQLSDENNKLRQEIKQYWKCRDKWKHEAKKLNDENAKLRDSFFKIKFVQKAKLDLIKKIKQLEEENEQLREALKNSYNWEICENCEYANYSSHYVYAEGIEYDFECLKGHAHVDEMSECDEFKLKIKGVFDERKEIC